MDPVTWQEHEFMRLQLARYKHAWETATHDDCLCPVNCQLTIEKFCPVHGLPSYQGSPDAEKSASNP